MAKEMWSDHASTSIMHFDHSFLCALKVRRRFDPSCTRASMSFSLFAIEPNGSRQSFPLYLSQDISPADHVPECSAQNPSTASIAKFGCDARICELVCSSEHLNLQEEIGTSLGSMKQRKLLSMNYADIDGIAWDHAISGVKLTTRSATVVVLDLVNSLELERELLLRFRSIQQLSILQARPLPSMPPFEYVGMYAMKKPKPFQRTRASLSHRRPGKLPVLATMRALAMNSQRGSGAPSPARKSRRLQLAMEHIHRGTETFALAGLQGLEGVSASQARLVLTQDSLCVVSHGVPVLDVPWRNVNDFEVVDEAHLGSTHNGVRFTVSAGAGPGSSGGGAADVFCVSDEVRLLMFTFEFFFNREGERRARAPKAQSAHGRRVRKVCTLTGDVDAPSPPTGSLEVIDVDGAVVRMAPADSGRSISMSAISSSSVERHASGGASGAGYSSGVLTSATASSWRYTNLGRMVDRARPARGLFQEDPEAAAHWPTACLHQGWVLKRGGLPWGWQRRYAVLWSTPQVSNKKLSYWFLCPVSFVLFQSYRCVWSAHRLTPFVRNDSLPSPRHGCQGHFLCYYSDFADAPPFTSAHRERNVVDLCKTTFIRPISDMAEAPPFAFDLCTIDREWTLCPESQKDQQRWLQLLTNAIEEDVAIVPDDCFSLLVKPRHDPSHLLALHAYKTLLRVGANGVSVLANRGGAFVEVFFWCYTVTKAAAHRIFGSDSIATCIVG